MSPWTRADELRDIANQTEDHNSAIRHEIASHRDHDWLDTQDDHTPTRAELADERNKEWWA